MRNLQKFNCYIGKVCCATMYTLRHIRVLEGELLINANTCYDIHMDMCKHALHTILLVDIEIQIQCQQHDAN